MKKIIILSTIISSLIYANDIKVKKYIINPGNYKIVYSGEEREFLTGINPGYGSGLTFKGINSDGSIEFYSITDRGPNTATPKYLKKNKELKGKFFPTPKFNPSIGVIKVTSEDAIIKDSIPIKNQYGDRVSGRIIPKNLVGSINEVGLNLDMSHINYDIYGVDTEGIAIDKDENFWLCDEYGPFILKVNKQGKIIEKYSPKEGLPNILKYRVPNRGFEGITVDENGNVFAIIQSPLDIENETKKTAKYTRIVKLNPNTKECTMYAYPLDNEYNDFSKAKIGDITSIGEGKFLVIEQGKQNDKMENRIYIIGINGASKIEDNGNLEYDRLNNLKPVKKELLLDLRKYGWNMEKAEGIALLPDKKTIAIVNDNDFGIETKIEDKEHFNSKLEDYIYNEDKKEFYYKGEIAKKVKMKITQNNKNERDSQLWLFKFKDKIEFR